jgi:hypothetical protein
MFKPESTSIHQGTYVSVLLAFSAATLAFWSIAPWLALLAGALQMALNCALYSAYMQNPSSAARMHPLPAQLALFAAALLGLLSVLWLCARRDADPGAKTLAATHS